MTTSIAPTLLASPPGRRLLVTLACATFIGLLNSLPSVSPTLLVLARAWLVGIVALGIFILFERWPRRLPAFLARWVWQLLGIIMAIPLATLSAYWLTTGGTFQFLQDPLARNGLMIMIVTGLLFAPWIALTAMLRQREAFARTQELAFALERSELERQAVDARMRLLQAQIQPHFLFNTLANVQALVDTGSPKASQVLATLISYLRAAVPRLEESFSSLEDEVALARAYLELMHLRMPDRLQFSIDIGADALGLRCPPLTLLTLVENAVRHGIDPGEEGGRIDIGIRLRDGHCHVLVSDTGVGLTRSGGNSGTGLFNLRERLRLSFGSSTAFELRDVKPHGVTVALQFPAQRSAS